MNVDVDGRTFSVRSKERLFSRLWVGLVVDQNWRFGHSPYPCLCTISRPYELDETRQVTNKGLAIEAFVEQYMWFFFIPLSTRKTRYALPIERLHWELHRHTLQSIKPGRKKIDLSPEEPPQLVSRQTRHQTQPTFISHQDQNTHGEFRPNMSNRKRTASSAGFSSARSKRSDSFEIIPASDSSFEIIDSPSNQNVMVSKEISRDKPDSFNVVVASTIQPSIQREETIVDSPRLATQHEEYDRRDGVSLGRLGPLRNHPLLRSIHGSDVMSMVQPPL